MRPTTRRIGPAIPSLCLWLAAVCIGGCRPAESGAMVRLPPPRNWESSLELQRQTRDESFRKSPESPLLPEDREAFEGLDYWPPDPDLYFVGPVHVYREPERLTLITTAGMQRPGERLGWVTFPIDGEMHTLQVYRLLDQPDGGRAQDLFLGFYDETSGEETYPAGRYLDLRGDGPYVLDFNRAYNPSCAYGAPERFACPRAPSENRLPLRIEAGERGHGTGEAPGG